MKFSQPDFVWLFFPNITAYNEVKQRISMDTMQFRLSLTHTEFSWLRQSSVLRCWRM